MPSPLRIGSLLAGLCALPAACAGAAPGVVVTAPAVSAEPAASGHAPPPEDRTLTACALPWNLDDVGDAHVVVTCGADVRREELAPGPMTRALAPGLEPARQKLCACAARMPVPAFADLVVRSAPAEGRVTVEADEVDDELDPEVARAFYGCIGAVVARFDPVSTPACGPGRAAFAYPLRVDLTR